MAVILLSIKPEYAEKIFAGTKKYEYRRHIASEKVEKIIVYSTAPVKQVIGEVDVDGILSMKMTPMWELTKHGAGISRDKYLFTLREDKEERFDNSFSMQLQIRINKNIFVMLMR